jgi:hypothetical protein
MIWRLRAGTHINERERNGDEELCDEIPQSERGRYEKLKSLESLKS